MLLYWMLMTGYLTSIAQAISSALRPDVLLTAYRGLPGFQLEISQAELAMQRSGLLLFYFLTIIGALALLRKENRDSGCFQLLLAGGLITVIAFTANAFDLVAFIPERWLPVSAIFLSIPAISGLTFIASAFRGQGRTVFSAAVISGIAFLMIISPSANIDYPVYKTTYRPDFTEAELEGAATLDEVYDGTSFTDQYYGMAVNDGAENAADMAPYCAFEDRELGEIPGPVLVRRYIAEKRMLRSDGIGVINLERDPRDILSDECFARVYDSGSLSIFLGPE
jgi:hypothetical protein